MLFLILGGGLLFCGVCTGVCSKAVVDVEQKEKEEAEKKRHEDAERPPRKSRHEAQETGSSTVERGQTTKIKRSSHRRKTTAITHRVLDEGDASNEPRVDQSGDGIDAGK